MAPKPIAGPKPFFVILEFIGDDEMPFGIFSSVDVVELKNHGIGACSVDQVVHVQTTRCDKEVLWEGRVHSIADERPQLVSECDVLLHVSKMTPTSSGRARFRPTRFLESDSESEDEQLPKPKKKSNSTESAGKNPEKLMREKMKKKKLEDRLLLLKRIKMKNTILNEKENPRSRKNFLSNPPQNTTTTKSTALVNISNKVLNPDIGQDNNTENKFLSKIKNLESDLKLVTCERDLAVYQLNEAKSKYEALQCQLIDKPEVVSYDTGELSEIESNLIQALDKIKKIKSGIPVIQTAITEAEPSEVYLPEAEDLVRQIFPEEDDDEKEKGTKNDNPHIMNYNNHPEFIIETQDGSPASENTSLNEKCSNSDLFFVDDEMDEFQVDREHLKYPEPGEGLVELMPGSKVYIPAITRANIVSRATTSSIVMRRAADAVLTLDCLKKCSVDGSSRSSGESRPPIHGDAKRSIFGLVHLVEMKKKWNKSNDVKLKRSFNNFLNAKRANVC